MISGNLLSEHIMTTQRLKLS